MIEHRFFITIPGLPLSAEAAWTPLIDMLEARHDDDLGPVISWDGDDAVIVVSCAADSEAHAAQFAVDAVSTALHDVGLGDRYPSKVELESVERPRPIAV